jgi:hypothetical protein
VEQPYSAGCYRASHRPFQDILALRGRLDRQCDKRPSKRRHCSVVQQLLTILNQNIFFQGPKASVDAIKALLQIGSSEHVRTRLSDHRGDVPLEFDSAPSRKVRRVVLTTIKALRVGDETIVTDSTSTSGCSVVEFREIKEVSRFVSDDTNTTNGGAAGCTLDYGADAVVVHLDAFSTRSCSRSRVERPLVRPHAIGIRSVIRCIVDSKFSP